MAIKGVRYSGSWDLQDDRAVYMNGDVVVAIAAPEEEPDAPYDHVILSGNVFKAFKRYCMELGVVDPSWPPPRSE